MQGFDGQDFIFDFAINLTEELHDAISSKRIFFVKANAHMPGTRALFFNPNDIAFNGHGRPVL